MNNRRSIQILYIYFLATGSIVAQFENLLDPAQLPYLKNSKMIQISSYDKSGGNNDYVSMKPNSSVTIAEMQGPGVIANIWVTIFAQDENFLRRMILRMYWDGEENPSVEVPIGDFFGTGFQYKHYVTPYIGMSSGGYYCYFPMPFRTSARIEVVNQSDQEVNSFYYHIDYHKVNQPLDSAVANFHSSWRREIRTDPAKNFTVLEAEGRGHFVGMNLNTQSYEKGLQYLEGDEMVYVDGEKEPSLYGTGTEDYFNGGWYFNRGEFAAPYHGVIIKNDSLSRIAAYRFHILDAIPFTRSINFTIEHGHANEEAADYAATAYWYQMEPHKKFQPMMKAGQRIPLRVAIPGKAKECEAIVPSKTALKYEVEDMSGFGADWSGNAQLKVYSGSGENRFSLALPATEEAYDVSLFYTRGPQYGSAAIYNDGKKITEIDCKAKTIVPGGKILLKNLKTAGGSISLDFVFTGEPDQKESVLGFDAYVLEPVRKFIPEWHMIGPFANPRDSNLVRQGIDIAYPVEKEFDTTKSYPGVDGKNIHWKLKKTPANGRMDMYDYTPYEMVVVYANTFIYSPKDQILPLLLGSDDGAKVFLNDKELHRVLKVRVITVDQDKVMLPLKKGWNRLLLKIENNYGGYNFYARILDNEKTLTVHPWKMKN